MWSCFFVDVCVEDMKGEKMHLKMRLGNFCDMSQVRTHTTMMAVNGCLGINFPQTLQQKKRNSDGNRDSFTLPYPAFLLTFALMGQTADPKATDGNFI